MWCENQINNIKWDAVVGENINIKETTLHLLKIYLVWVHSRQFYICPNFYPKILIYFWMNMFLQYFCNFSNFICWKNISFTKNLIKGKIIFSFQINIIFEYYIKKIKLKNKFKKMLLIYIYSVKIKCRAKMSLIY